MKAPGIYLITLFSLQVLVLISSCEKLYSSFDRKKWDSKEDWDYPYRNDIVEDLISDHQLKGLPYKQLTDSLGAPENFTNTDGVYYQLIMDFGDDIDPVHTKYLVFKLNKDSVVTGFRIKEWRKGD